MTTTTHFPITHALVNDAGYRIAGRPDVRRVLELVSESERRRPGGLLGHASRYLPRRFVIAIAGFGILRHLAAGDLAYDPAGAAIAVQPQSRERLARRAAATAVAMAAVALLATAAGLAVLAAAQLLPGTLAAAPPLALATVASLSLVSPAKVIIRRRRVVAAAARRGPVLFAGSYVGRPGAAARLLTMLLAACDRAGVTVVAETHGEARIRRFRQAGFRVEAITIRQRRSRLRPARDAKVLLVRHPTRTAGNATSEQPDRLWRHRPLGRVTPPNR